MAKLYFGGVAHNGGLGFLSKEIIMGMLTHNGK